MIRDERQCTREKNKKVGWGSYLPGNLSSEQVMFKGEVKDLGRPNLEYPRPVVGKGNSKGLGPKDLASLSPSEKPNIGRETGVRRRALSGAKTLGGGDCWGMRYCPDEKK